MERNCKCQRRSNVIFFEELLLNCGGKKHAPLVRKFIHPDSFRLVNVYRYVGRYKYTFHTNIPAFFEIILLIFRIPRQLDAEGYFQLRHGFARNSKAHRNTRADLLVRH